MAVCVSLCVLYLWVSSVCFCFCFYNRFRFFCFLFNNWKLYLWFCFSGIIGFNFSLNYTYRCSFSIILPKNLWWILCINYNYIIVNKISKSDWVSMVSPFLFNILIYVGNRKMCNWWMLVLGNENMSLTKHKDRTKIWYIMRTG